MRTPWLYSRIFLSLLLLLFMVGPPSLAQEEATGEPTAPPTEIPTEVPTEPPPEVATEVPTEAPMEPPTAIPTEAPTEPPPVEVTEAATEPPTEVPTQVEVTAEPIPLAEVTAEATLETLFAPAPLVARVEPVTEASLMVARVFVVNSTGDANDLNFPGPIYNGICDTDAVLAGNQCTLRAAIQEANFTPDKDTINFNIPGAGPHIITPATPLSSITQSVIINGASQPYYTWGTPRIVLDGLGSGAALWLDVSSSGSTIKGLVINGWFTGIEVYSANNLIQANFIGTNPTGTAGDVNSYGIHTFTVGTTANTIGGTTAALRNLISGNTGSGVWLGAESSGSRVLGNYIGTNKTGTLAIANGTGVTVNASNGNTIGGATAAARNLISGNTSDGIVITSFVGSNDNLVLGNYIGTNAAGTGNLFNGGDGVEINNGSGNVIGGAYPQAANRIANNGGDGIWVFSGTGNRLLTNWIYNNGGLGIDLATDGLTDNDWGAMDGDVGANDVQNWPALRRATGTRYIGSLDSDNNEFFRLQFFASPTCNAAAPNYFGEGQKYLGTAVVGTDNLGIANFDLTLPVAAPTGWAVTATATSLLNNTSEFGNCVKANLGAPLLLSPANNSLTSNINPPFSWRAVPGAELYRVERSRLPTFNADVTSTVVPAPTTSTTSLPAMQPGESYYWRVVAIAFDEYGPYSATWRINIGP